MLNCLNALEVKEGEELLVLGGSLLVRGIPVGGWVRGVTRQQPIFVKPFTRGQVIPRRSSYSPSQSPELGVTKRQVMPSPHISQLSLATQLRILQQPEGICTLGIDHPREYSTGMRSGLSSE